MYICLKAISICNVGGHCNLAMCSTCVLMFLKALGLRFICSMAAVTKMMQFSLNFI